MSRDVIIVDLALQGGGARGAYTWGVLDHLLEEPWLQIEGISGTSAGAMNAAALISDGCSRNEVVLIDAMLLVKKLNFISDPLC